MQYNAQKFQLRIDKNAEKKSKVLTLTANCSSIVSEGDDHMYCNKCGAEIDDNSVFCNKCGKQIKDDKPILPNTENAVVTDSKLKLKSYIVFLIEIALAFTPLIRTFKLMCFLFMNYAKGTDLYHMIDAKNKEFDGYSTFCAFVWIATGLFALAYILILNQGRHLFLSKHTNYNKVWINVILTAASMITANIMNLFALLFGLKKMNNYRLDFFDPFGSTFMLEVQPIYYIIIIVNISLIIFSIRKLKKIG